MSYRKTKLIQEKNILLEKKYISEQATTTTTTTSPITTTTTTQKITKDFYENLTSCSSVKNPTDVIEIKTEFGIVLKDSKGKLPYCKK